MIGVEFASIFRHFGTEVTIVEMLEHLIPMEDADASKELERAFKRRGIAAHLGARATEIAVADRGVTLRFEGADGTAGSVDADLVLVATGRGRVVEGHRAGGAGVKFDRPRGVIADRHMRTNVPHIYAVGDVAGRLPARAHRVPRGRGRGRERDRPRRRDGLRPCRAACTPIPRWPPSA